MLRNAGGTLNCITEKDYCSLRDLTFLQKNLDSLRRQNMTLKSFICYCRCARQSTFFSVKKQPLSLLNANNEAIKTLVNSNIWLESLISMALWLCSYNRPPSAFGTVADLPRTDPPNSPWVTGRTFQKERYQETTQDQQTILTPPAKLRDHISPVTRMHGTIRRCVSVESPTRRAYRFTVLPPRPLVSSPRVPKMYHRVAVTVENSGYRGSASETLFSIHTHFWTWACCLSDTDWSR